MGNWTDEGRKREGTIQKYAPKDITDSRDFVKELREIDQNRMLTVVDKYKHKKQLMKAVYLAKQREIDHHLDSFENFLLAKKDVEAKTITLEAQKAIMTLERQQARLMDELGLSHTEEISDTLIKSGNMLTRKMEEVSRSPMEADIKAMMMENIRAVWMKTIGRIQDSVDTYMDELKERERGRG